MIPGTHNFTVVLGTSAEDRSVSPLVLAFSRQGVGLPFSRATLSIYDKANAQSGTLIFRTSTADDGPGRLEITDMYTGEVTWFPSTTQTRLLKLGAKNFYEVELILLGSEVVYLTGVITGQGGLNDDSEVS